jgi:hypothetical protein
MSMRAGSSRSAHTSRALLDDVEQGGLEQSDEGEMIGAKHADFIRRRRPRESHSQICYVREN